MTISEPNPRVRPTGVEPGEFLEDAEPEPAPPPADDREHQVDDEDDDEDDDTPPRRPAPGS